MTGSELGDLVLVPFPFTDQSTSKRRPAVVVSSDAYHRERPDLIILAVTSQARPEPAFGEAAVAKWKEAGLLKRNCSPRPVSTLGGAWSSLCARWRWDQPRSLGSVTVPGVAMARRVASAR